MAPKVAREPGGGTLGHPTEPALGETHSPKGPDTLWAKIVAQTCGRTTDEPISPDFLSQVIDLYEILSRVEKGSVLLVVNGIN